jgi:hypothetical protein
MKLLAIAVMLFACGKKADEVDHWPEVERMATPAIPGGDGALLDSAIAKVNDPASANNDDVPEAALEDAIAWRAANGGLSWRTDRPHKFDVRPFKLGEALLERRGDDPAAIATVLYLGHRLRAESPNFIGVMTGVTLAQKVMEKRPPWSPEYAAWAPTESELRRGLATEAVMLVDAVPDDDKEVRPSMTRWYGELLVGAPQERAAFLAHVDRMVAKAQGSQVLEMIVMSKLRERLEDMYKTIDEYHAWQGALPKP